MFNLAAGLQNHQPFNETEHVHLLHTRHVLNHVARCFWRDQFAPGHIVGSAWITSPDFRHILMIFHPVIQRWVMPGGHSDGDDNTLNVALREVAEEVGLEGGQLDIWQGGKVFDVDAHRYPANPKKNEPEHMHYDVRFLLTTSRLAEAPQSPEGARLKWFTLAEAEDVCRPQADKLRCLQKIQKLSA